MEEEKNGGRSKELFTPKGDAEPLNFKKLPKSTALFSKIYTLNLRASEIHLEFASGNEKAKLSRCVGEIQQAHYKLTPTKLLKHTRLVRVWCAYTLLEPLRRNKSMHLSLGSSEPHFEDSAEAF